MTYKAIILNKHTSESREYFFDDIWDDNIEYMWNDGNFACDCNRGNFFARAAREPDPETKCGMEIYSVKIEVDGKVVYED